MKKRALVVVLAFMMIFAVVACAVEEASAPAPAPAPAPEPEAPAPAPAPDAPAPEPTGEPWEGKRLGIAHITFYDEWCMGVYDEFTRQAPLMGFGEINIQNGDLNAELQTRQVEDFITQQYDMILIDPVNPEILLPALQRAHEAGIPVIAFDSGTDFEHLITHVAWDHAETGVLTGHYIADYVEANLDGKVNVGILAMLYAPHTAIRSETFKETLEARLGAENITYVFDQDFGQSREDATMIVENNIARPMDFIWAAVDNAAFGAKVALELNAIQGTKIVSAGAWGSEPFNAMNDGDPWYMMAIGVSPEEIVRLSLESAQQWFAGNTNIPRSQNIELSIIDQSNIGNFMHFVQ